MLNRIKHLWWMVALASMTALAFAVPSNAAVTPIPEKCDAANALWPAVSNVVGEALGFKKFVPAFVLVLLVGLIFFAMTRHSRTIWRGIIFILAIGIILAVAQPFIGTIFSSNC